MKYKNGVIFLLVLYIILNCCQVVSKVKKKVNKIKNKNDFLTSKYRRKKNITNFSKRKLEEDESPVGTNNFSFVPLSIYIDTTEFNITFPTELDEKYRDNFIIAMNKSRDILQDLLEIYVDVGIAANIDFGRLNIEDRYEIYNYGEIFTTKVRFTEYNFFIFPKFYELNVEITSILVDEQSEYPFAGVILFNNKSLDYLDESKMTVDSLTPLMLHHFIRLLGFIEEVTGIFQSIPFDTVNQVYYLSIEAEEGENTFPNVINYARKYFNCSKIDRIDLFYDEENVDEDGDAYKYAGNDLFGLYWPKRLFLGELMTKYDFSEERVLSGFTIAFLDDLEYLRVKKNSTYFGGLMKFGKNKGCDFYFKNCGNDSVSSSTFANEFYLPTISNNVEPSCSSGRLSKTIYKLNSISEEDLANEENIFEYILDNKGGPKSTNYCPIAHYDSTYTYVGSCSDIGTLNVNNDRKEVLGNNSFCVISSLEQSSNENPEFLPICYEMNCSHGTLKIKIGDTYIVCPREGGQVKVKGFQGTLLCPDYNLICTSSTLCNNILNCLEKKSEELNETFYYDYEIETTQNSSVYNKDNPKLNYGWELTNDGICPYLCMQCKSKEDCDKCRPHYKYENNKCINAVPNCIDFESNETDICTKCNEGYILVEDSDNNRFCVDESEKNYYYHYSVNNIEIYKKCDEKIIDCMTCTYDTTKVNNVKCNLCKNSYIVINDGEADFCGDFSSQLYYEYSSNSYKSCKYHPTVQKCNKCEKNGESITCLECETNYVLYYNTPQPVCIDKDLVDGTIYSTDDKKYYPCNNSLYNDISYCSECTGKATCSNCRTDYTIANGNSKCILTADINALKYYQDPDDNNYYYECSHSLEHCFTCYNKNKCKDCITSYVVEESDICISYSLYTSHLYYLDSTTNKYFSCSKIANCEQCTSSIDCIKCKEGFNFIKGNDNNLICEDIDTNKYYPVTEDSKTYYKKCEDKITNCDECSSENYCTKCKDNFGIIGTDHTKCESLLEEKYYYDTTLEQFKLCSFKTANCELCSTYGDFVCKKCFGDLVLKHESNNNIQCEQKTFFNDKKTYFKDEEEKNYYLCSFYNDISNCVECKVKEICDKCNNGYDLENNQTLCASQVDKDNNIYIYNPQGLLVTCSSIYQDCNRCNETHKCIECQEGAGLIDNNTCLSKATIEEEHHYYKDETTNSYISCSVMNNCITCSSSTICTSCQTGFKINNNNLCEKINESNDENDDNKGLSTGAIIGIVIGCVAFLALVAFLVYYLYNKFFKKSNVDNIKMNTIGDKADIDIAQEKKEIIEEETVKEEKFEHKEPDIHTTKRSIHNKN